MKKSIKFAGTTSDDEDGSKSGHVLQTDKEFSSSQNTPINNMNVEIRVVFLKIGSISIKDNKFTCEAFVEASWFDSNFKSKKSQKPSGEDLNYNEKINWNPRIIIQNLTASSTQEIWYHVEKLKFGYKISERRRLKGEFSQSFNLENFPFDLQELGLSISSLRSSKEININLSKEKLSSVNVSTFMQTHEWILYPTVSHSDSLKQSYFADISHTILDVNVCVSRKPTYYYWNSFLLNFIITLICFCCYSIRCDISANRMIIGITVLLTLITFKLTLSKYLPSLSYLTIIDQYSLMNIMIIFFNCAYFAIMGVITPQFCTFPYNKIDNYVFYGSISLFILLNIFLIVKVAIIGFKNKKLIDKQFKEYNMNSAGKRTRIKSIFQSNNNQHEANDE